MRPTMNTSCHVAVDLLRYMRFVVPGDIVTVLAHVVVRAGTRVEFERIATDHFLFAVVG